MIGAVVVVVPVHDEADLLAACLRSIGRAVAALPEGIRAETWVALDACTDDSPAIARRLRARSVVVHDRCVGRARAAGVDAALAHLAHPSPDRVWTAHTDGDSVVPQHWLTTQLEMADQGADVVVGTVRPEFRDLTPSQRRAWWSTHTPGVANGHVHGANLGIRASALLSAGGFDGVPVHEDVMLVQRLRDGGAVVAASDAAWVRTSGRQVGRAPDGYARYLRDDLVALARAVG